MFGPTIPPAGRGVKHPIPYHSFCLPAFGLHPLFIDISYFSPFDSIPLLPPVTDSRFVSPFPTPRSDCPVAYWLIRELRLFSSGYIIYVLYSHPILPPSVFTISALTLPMFL